MDARFWVNLQAEYGMRSASRALQQGAAQRTRPVGCNFSRAQNPEGAPGPPLPHPPGGTVPMICTILSTVDTSVSGVTLPITPRSVTRFSVATLISSVK